MNKVITKYSLFLLLFLLFHLLTWRLINIFQLSPTINFLIQFLVFSSFTYFLKFINFEIIFISILTVEMLDYYIEKEEILVEDIYKLEKLSSNYLIEKRLEEQQNSGLIIINEDNLELTLRGKFIGIAYKYLGILYQK